MIVAKNRVQQRRNHAVVNSLEVLCLANISLNQFEDFLLNCPQLTNFRRFRGNLSYYTQRIRRSQRYGSEFTFFGDRFTNYTTDCTIESEHVHIDQTNLG